MGQIPNPNLLVDLGSTFSRSLSEETARKNVGTQPIRPPLEMTVLSPKNTACSVEVPSLLHL